MKNTKFFLIILFSFILYSNISFAHEYTHIAGAPFYWEQNKKQDFGFKFNAGFGFNSYNAALNHEYQGNGGLDIVKDLSYNKTTFSLNLGAEAGFKNVAFFMNLPIIISQKSTFKFQSGNRYPNYEGYDECLASHALPNGDGNTAACNPDGVNALNSRTVQEGIAAGLDFSDNPLNGDPGQRTLMKGPERRGLDQLHLGLKLNIPGFNQYLDDSKPFWVLAVDFGLPVGDVMDFKRTYDGVPECSGGSRCSDPLNQRPNLNSAVGKGIYDITLSSIMSRRYGHFDYFFKMYATLPFAYTSDSLYSGKYNFSGDWGMKTPKAPIKGGLFFGTDLNVYKDPVKKIRVNLFFQGNLTAVFEGQDYSEGYELFAGSPTLNFSCDSSNSVFPQFCNDNRLRSIQYFPGLTTVENHMILGIKLGINMRISQYFYMSAVYGAAHHTEHFITYTDAGIDEPSTDPNRITGVVDLDSNEANPYYRPSIDQVGHRYRVQESIEHAFLLSFSVMY